MVRESLVKGNVADTCHFSEVETEAQGWCYLPGYKLISDRSESRVSTPQILSQYCWQILSLGHMWGIWSPNTITISTNCPKRIICNHLVKVLPGLKKRGLLVHQWNEVTAQIMLLSQACFAFFLSSTRTERTDWRRAKAPFFRFV